MICKQTNKNINVNPRKQILYKNMIDHSWVPGEHQQNLVQHQGNYRGYPNKRPYSEPIPKYLNRPRPDDKK